MTKDLFPEGFCRLSGKDPSFTRTLVILGSLPLRISIPFRRMTRLLQRAFYVLHSSPTTYWHRSMPALAGTQISEPGTARLPGGGASN